jgi:hypothetical protein
MNSARRLLLLLLPLALCLDAGAQSVGRVIAAAGEVGTVRSNRAIPLTAGAAIENGDLVTTGEASAAQLRFTDGTVVALRAKSEFRVDGYRFTGEDDGVSQAVFSLLKGGLRTLTGLIGKSRAESYRMRTPLATVGIRGTAYALVLCQRDCDADEGGLAPDGAYGVVFEGRVAVANDAAEVTFDVDEAFYVAGPATAPQRLLSRPGFLRDRLEARARREERREQLEARAQALAERREQLAKLAIASDVRGSLADARPLAQAGTAASPIVVSELADESGNVALLGAGLGAGVAFATAQSAVSIVDGGRGTVIVLDPDRGTLEQFAFNGGLQAGDRQGALVTDRGSVPGDGGAVFGRWTPGAAVQLNGLTGVPSTGVHFFFGNLSPESLFSSVPAAATAVRYDYVDGPRPTDGAGNTGQFLSGSFLVNFVNRSIAGSLNYRVDTVTYTLPVPSSTPLVSRGGFVGFNVAGSNAGAWSCSCNGAIGALDAYSVSGLFLGSRAQGLGVTFATDDSRVGRTAGAAIFRCNSVGCR